MVPPKPKEGETQVVGILGGGVNQGDNAGVPGQSGSLAKSKSRTRCCVLGVI